MFAINSLILTLILIFTTIASGSQNGERYDASSEAQLPGKQAASHINEKAIDDTARNNIIGDVNKTHNDKHAVENKRMGHNLESPSNGNGINFPPRFNNSSILFNKYQLQAGRSVTLNCSANGNPTPTITWYKNNGHIVRRYFQPRYVKWSMTLDGLTSSDNGIYKCLICNELGCISQRATLIVRERDPLWPSVKTGFPGNKTAFVHNTVRLTCPISSALEYFLYWLKPAKNYNWNGHVGAKEPIPEGLVIQSDDDTDKPEVLTLYNVTKDKGGWYVCVVFNTLGRAFAKGYLTVLDRKNQHNEA